MSPATALHQRPLPFWPLQIAGWTGYGVETLLSKIGYGRPLELWHITAIDAGCGFVLTLVIRAVLKATWNQSPRERMAWGIVVLIGTSLVGAFVWWFSVLYLCEPCKLPVSWLGFIGYFFGWLQLLGAWTGAYVGIKLARQLQQERETTLRATAMAHQAQLRMLRYQLNPHFLFNTLNAISTLVLDGRNEQANGMVGALSGFLRHSLDSDPEQKVSLDQEVSSIQRYLTIEQVRFGERLKVGILITPPAGDALVPSLILQPLIENAVKFGISRREEGGRIEIIARVLDSNTLELVLRDNGPGCLNYNAERSDSPGGVGIANTRERLRVLYGDRHHFEIAPVTPQGTEVRLQFPFEPSTPEPG